MQQTRYEQARETYRSIGIDTDAALEALGAIPISMHCWQGDDVGGFEGGMALSGGIQATGNYPGKAGNFGELTADIDKALSMIPGKHRLNLHASYAVFENGFADRDKIEPQHFEKWADFAKKRGLGLDFNPTFFSHPKAVAATLSCENEEIRSFWIEHAKRCIKIAEYFAGELGTPSLVNIWIPDGFKEMPADRISPRQRLKDSLDKITGCGYDKSKVRIAVESKVFGIGLESYTVGSHEFYITYAAKNGILCLLDNGHFHPTESICDKISSMLLFSPMLALHVTRAVRWDSDHIVLYDDETREIANEIIRHGADRFMIGLDFFDASVNRIAAWVIGMRNMQKSLLQALLTPHEHMAHLQRQRNFSELLMFREELKTFPAGDVWDRFCLQNSVPEKMQWYEQVKKYEAEVLALRGKR